MEFKKLANEEWQSSSFVDCFNATTDELINTFGEPHYIDDSIGEKTQKEWDFYVDGNVVSIYDWKEYRKYSNDEVIEWHIGSNCHDRDFVDAVKKSILLKIRNGF